MSHADEATSPYHPPHRQDAVETPLRLSADRVFFGVAAVVALLFGLWHGKQAAFYAQRGMPNDHLVAISSASIATGLILVFAASVSLSVGISRFRQSRHSGSARVASIVTVALLTMWGGLLAAGGARQGIFLLVACLLWACAFFFEMRRQYQNSFTPLRWSLRTMAVVVALPVLAGGASLIFDAMNLYNKLHMKSSIPVFNRMPANIPESDAMIIGDLCIGVPFASIGILLMREAFRGFVLWQHRPSLSEVSRSSR